MKNRRMYNRFLEKIRILKVNMLFSLKDTNKKIIAVTSGEEGVGKTLVSLELAKSIAEDGEKVLLLDFDLRNPKLKSKIKIHSKYGVTDVLLGKTSLNDAVIEVDKNLSVLKAGALVKNPLTILKDDILESLFSELRQKYKYVIIDTNSVCDYAETQFLISKVDGIILVVVPNKTKKSELMKCKKVLEFINGYLVGVIFNKVN